MVQAQGGTIEPLFYALLLWLLRRRAVAFGLLFAFGFLQREFTLFAVLAIVGSRLDGRTLLAARAAHWLVVWLVFIGAQQGVSLLRHTASMFGPARRRRGSKTGSPTSIWWLRSVCLAPGHDARQPAWLVGHNVPTFFGAQTQPAGILVLSRRTTGTPWAGIASLDRAGVAAVVVLRRGPRWLPLLQPPPDARVCCRRCCCSAGCWDWRALPPDATCAA